MRTLVVIIVVVVIIIIIFFFFISFRRSIIIQRVCVCVDGWFTREYTKYVEKEGKVRLVSSYESKCFAFANTWTYRVITRMCDRWSQDVSNREAVNSMRGYNQCSWTGGGGGGDSRRRETEDRPLDPSQFLFSSTDPFTDIETRFHFRNIQRKMSVLVETIIRHNGIQRTRERCVQFVKESISYNVSNATSVEPKLIGRSRSSNRVKYSAFLERTGGT